MRHVPGFDQGWLGYGEGEDRATEGGMRCRHYRRGVKGEGENGAMACSPPVM